MKKVLSFLLLSSILITSTIYSQSYSKTKVDTSLKKQKKILFIGNSFTSVNNLPDTFKKLAIAGGFNVYVDQCSPSSYTLERQVDETDHNGKKTVMKIKSKKWDYVVLQEQSQYPAYADLRIKTNTAAKKLDTLIKKSGSKTVFFMTWGYKNGDELNSDVKETQTFEGMQEQLRIGYTDISKKLSAILAPVGLAWLKAKSVDANISLWAADDKHPSLEGTYLSSCVFYKKLLGKSPEGLKYYGGLTAKQASFLQSIATKTCLEN